MERYKRFSDEQISVANQVNLVEYLRQQGETLTKSGKDMRWNRYTSVTIRGNQYYKWKTQEGGYPIQFLKEFYGYNFKQAMELLLSFANDTGMIVDVHPEEEVKKEFIMPERNDSMRRVYGYLLNGRCIDKEVLNAFVQKGLIYEDAVYHNAVFVGYDEEGVPRHAHKRSTLINGGFRGNVEGSDPRYTFHYLGQSNQIYVFEAPIDMLSYISLHKENWQEHSYIALNGLGTQGLEHLLDTNDSLKKVFLCFDHDEAGIEGAERVLDVLHDRQMIDASIIQPKNKDFNEDLKELHGIEVIKAVDNPKYMEMYTEIENLKNSHFQLTGHDEITHTTIGNQFMKVYYAFNKNGKNDFYNLNKQSEKLLKLVLTMEHQLLYKDVPFTKESKVWDILKDDYRAYKDNGNINKSIHNVFNSLKDIKTGLDNHESNQILADIYRQCSSDLLNMKLQIRRELVRNMEMKEKLGLEESLRPEAKMIGEDGNVFNLMGICSNALKKAGYPEKSKEMFDRVTSCGSYDEALAIMNEYVIPTGDEQSFDDAFDMEMKGY